MKTYIQVYPVYVVSDSNKNAHDILNNYFGSTLIDSPGFIGYGEYQLIRDGKSGIPIYFTDPINAYNFCELVDSNYIYTPNPDYRVTLPKPMPVYQDNLIPEKNNIVSLSQTSLDTLVKTVNELLDTNKLTENDLFSDENMPFTNFTLKIDGCTAKINYSYENSHLVTSKLTMTHGYLVHKLKIYSDYSYDIIADYNMVDRTEIKSKNLYDMFWYILFYIKNLPATYTKKSEKKSEIFTVGKSYNKKIKHITYLKTEYTFNNRITKTHIKHLFKCLCWGVRGHYRHYSNGKTIFIPEYKKGKKRNTAETEQKTYKIK